MKSIIFIGHVAVDIIKEPESKLIPGGGVYYGADAVKAVSDDVNVKIFTKMAPEHVHLFDDLTTRGIDLEIIETPSSTTFENVYPDSNPDHRISYCHEKAAAWSVDDLSKLKSDAIIISALWTPEFPEEIIPEVRHHTDFLVVDVQGYTRYIRADNSIEHHDWKNKKDYFKYFDLIKLDAKEATMLTGKTDMFEALDELVQLCSESAFLVCTHKNGIVLKGKNRIYESSFGEYSIKGRTGRGDTVTAVLTTFLINGMDEQKALDKTAEITTIKMQHIGSLRREYIG